jgi:uncharacterized protein
MSWMQVFSGKRFYPLDPAPHDVDIVDIAHALAMKCRFGGHCKQFYSVAQHSVLVARHASQEDALRALLHDAHEAYSPFGDVPRPIKNAEPALKQRIAQIEDRLDLAIAAKFGLPTPIKNKAIDILDNRILHDEREHVMVPTNDEWSVPYGPLGLASIPEWSPLRARAEFLSFYDQAVIWQRMYGGAA